MNDIVSIVGQCITAAYVGVSSVWLVKLVRAVRVMDREMSCGFNDVYEALCDIGDTVADQHCECCTIDDEYPVDLAALEADRRARIAMETAAITAARMDLLDWHEERRS